MDAQKLIEKINEVVVKACKESSDTMDKLVYCFDRKNSADFYKASGVHQMAHEIEELIINSGYYVGI